MSENENPNFKTAKEAADLLRMTPGNVRRLCREGILGASHPGRAWLIPQASIDGYLEIRR